jgi:hypothetical protein
LSTAAVRYDPWADLQLVRSGRRSTWPCWEAVPAPDAPHVGCTGCGDRFETLTEFEWHIREQETSRATIAEVEANIRRRQDR